MAIEIDNSTNVLTQPINFTVGRALTATNYEIGRNNDGTNQMQFNVPTGAGHEFSINDVAQVVISGSAIRLANTLDIQGGYANGGGAPYDGVVDAGGGGNWTTIQAGDDALDGGDFTMLVKSGTYAESPTISTNDVTIVFEPGTDIQGVITLSGSNISLIFGSGCDIDGMVVSGNDCYINGGGWDTLSNGGTALDGIDITGTDCIVENMAFQTTAGGGSGQSGVRIAGARGQLRNLKIPDSDNHGIILTSGGDTQIIGCTILGADGDGINHNSPRTIVIGNRIVAAGVVGIQLGSDADNSICNGNIVQDQAGDSIDINDAAIDCVIVGNRLDGAVDEGSGGSTVDNNNTDAF